MSNYYEAPSLAASPFLVAPIGAHNNEAESVIAPAWLASDPSIIRLLYQPLAKLRIINPIIGQILLYKSYLIAATTVRTHVVDRVSGRTGGRLIIGAAIHPRVLLLRDNVTSFVLTAWDSFIFRNFGSSLSQGGSDEVVLRLQDESGDLVFKRLDALLGSMESELCLTDRPPISIFKSMMATYRIRKTVGKGLIRSVQNFDQLYSYWKYVDTCLCLASRG